MAHLVKQNVDVLLIDVVEEVVRTDLLAPVVSITTHLTFKTLVEPEADVVTAGLTAGALAQIAIEMSAAVAADVALRYTVGISCSVDVKTGGVAFDEVLVLDGVANNVDIEFGEREAFESNEYIEPLLHRALQGFDSRGTRSRGAFAGVVPANAVVDTAVVGDPLVGDPVLVLEALRVLLHSLLPDLIQTSGHARGRIPCCRFGDSGAGSKVFGTGKDAAFLERAEAPVNVLDGWVCQRTQTKCRKSDDGIEVHHGDFLNE